MPKREYPNDKMFYTEYDCKVNRLFLSIGGYCVSLTPVEARRLSLMLTSVLPTEAPSTYLDEIAKKGS